MLTQTEAERLLDELSLEFGFRLPIHERQLLVADPPDDVARFTDAVFIAEGLSPSTADRRQYERVRDAVAKTFEGGDARAARAALALDARLPSLIGLSLDERKKAHQMTVKLEAITALSEFLRSAPEDWVFEGMSVPEEDATRRQMRGIHSAKGPSRFHLFIDEYDLFWGNGCDVIIRRKTREQFPD